jgi:hypothetical protein
MGSHMSEESFSRWISAGWALIEERPIEVEEAPVKVLDDTEREILDLGTQRMSIDSMRTWIAAGYALAGLAVPKKYRRYRLNRD